MTKKKFQYTIECDVPKQWILLIFFNKRMQLGGLASRLIETVVWKMFWYIGIFQIISYVESPIWYVFLLFQIKAKQTYTQ